MTPTVPEVLELVAKAKTKNEKANLLRQNNSFALRTILQGIFHPNIKLDLPEGDPPYIPDPAPLGHSPSSLHVEIRKVKYFFGPTMAQKKMKREEIFIGMLESVHPKEADLLLQMKNKKLNCVGLTYELAEEVFPELSLPKRTRKEKKTDVKEQA